MCFSSCLRQDKPYPSGRKVFRSANGRGQARNSRAISTSFMAANAALSTDTNRFKTGRRHELSVSANSPCPRSVHANNRVRKQSVSAHRQRPQSSVNRQRQRTWIVRRQSAAVNNPRSRTGHGRNLSATVDRQRVIRVAALSCPHGVGQFPGFHPNHFALCPHLIQPKSARRSQNLRRAGHRSSRIWSRRKRSSLSCGRKADRIVPSPNCSRNTACRPARRPLPCSVTKFWAKTSGHASGQRGNARRLRCQ